MIGNVMLGIFIINSHSHEFTFQSFRECLKLCVTILGHCNGLLQNDLNVYGKLLKFRRSDGRSVYIDDFPGQY